MVEFQGVLPGPLETGTKGPREHGQVGNMGVRVSGSAATKCWAPPLAKRRSIEWYFILVCSPSGFSPEALHKVFPSPVHLLGNLHTLKKHRVWRKEILPLELSGHRKSLQIARGLTTACWLALGCLHYLHSLG